MFNNLLTDSYPINESSALLRFAKELKEYCSDDVSVLADVKITSDMISVDAVVDYHGMIVAIIECVKNEKLLSVVRRDISKIIKRAQVQIGIVVTESGDYYLRKYSNTRSKKVKISIIAEEIRSVYKNIQENLDPDVVKKELIKLYDESPKFKMKEALRPMFEQACNNLNINKGYITLNGIDEDRIMLGILSGGFSSDMQVCRYTSLDSLFNLFDSNTQPMCGPVSMNDRDECDYADSFMPWHVKRNRGEVEIEADNSYFLLSCSDIAKSDILTMWRLYGDNAKGVCVEYVVDSDKIDNKRYFIGPVSYGVKSNTGKYVHPELEFIAYMQAKAISPGWYFSLTKWYIWKFFFKSWTYREENEIRLVYRPDMENDDEYNRIKWYKDRSNGIFNKMALIPIMHGERKDFPLNISKIILGPHLPEMSRNLEQIWYMAQQKGVDTVRNFSVQPSEIKSYR